MNKFSKITAIVLSALMLFSLIPIYGLAEESEVSTIAEAFNVTLKTMGPSDSFTCYINGTAVTDTYSGTDDSLEIKVVPAEGFVIKAAAFGPVDSSQSLTENDDKSFTGTFTPVAGAEHIIFVQTEEAPSAPAKSQISVESNMPYEVYGPDNSLVSDISSAEFAVGDTVKVKFTIEGEFESSRADLSVNGSKVSLSAAEYSFVLVEGKNTVKFNYDTSAPKVPATFNFDNVTTGFKIKDSKGNTISDYSSIMVGDKLTITFDNDGTFIPDNAKLNYNGTDVALKSASYTFTAEETNVFAYSYAPVAATITVNAGDVAWWIYADDGTQLDVSSSTILTGDKLKIVFDNTFTPDARLFINGKRQNLENVEHTFTVTSANMLIELKGAVNVDVDIETHGKDFSEIGFTVTVNGTEVDHATHKYEEGDEITITFKVSDFKAENALIKLNNTEESINDKSFTFVATSINSIVFGYNVSPVKFSIKGLGSIDVFNEAGEKIATVTNTNASGRKAQTLYLNKGGNYTFAPKAAFNYELSGKMSFDSISASESGGKYSVTIGGEGTASVDFAKAQSSVPSYNVNINVNAGGVVDLETSSGTVKNIVGGITGSDITEVAEGDSIVFTITPDEGFLLDKVLVDNEKITVDGNTFTISGIISQRSVDIFFKTEGPIDPADIIGVEDVDWFASTITINVPDGKVLSGEIFNKIATDLDAASGKYVEIVLSGAIIYFPYGGVIADVGETVSLGCTVINTGKEFTDIKAAVSDQFEKGSFFRVFSLTRSEQMPAGTKISFNLGTGYANKPVGLYTFDGNAFFDVSKVALTGSSGYTEKFDYGNQPTIICVNEPNGSVDISGDESDSSETHIENSNDDKKDDNDDSEKGGNGVVVMIIIIALVAVAGAAALFIVKWRQEKF